MEVVLNAEADRIENALADLLTAAIDDDARVMQTRSDRLVATPFRMPERIATRAEIEISALLDQPVGAACRQSIRRLGFRLFEVTGSTDGMRDVGERAADQDPQRYGRRVAIVDSAWNGIGNETDRWWS